MDQFFTIKEGEEYLTQLDFIHNRIYEGIYVLGNNIDEKISQIAGCKTFEESLTYFDEARTLLAFLYKCRTKYNFDLSDKTRKMMDDFERIDVLSLKELLWQKITSGMYQT